MILMNCQECAMVDMSAGTKERTSPNLISHKSNEFGCTFVSTVDSAVVAITVTKKRYATTQKTHIESKQYHCLYNNLVSNRRSNICIEILIYTYYTSSHNH